MNVLISGGCKNGKSSLSQELACHYAKKSGKAPLYYATMIPHDREDEERIALHIKDREGLGFETLEMTMEKKPGEGEIQSSFSSQIDKIEEGRVILLDSLTALLANEFFEGRKDFSLPAILEDFQKITKRIKKDLARLVEKSDSVIFVCDYIFSDQKYDEITQGYMKALAEIQSYVISLCDKSYEMTAGLKDEIMKNNGEGEITNSFSGSLQKPLLIIGGAFQGKKDFARKHFSLKSDDFYVCREDCPPDFSKRCIVHLENYIAFCLKKNLPIKCDFLEENPVKDNNKWPKILICDDIFCGVVPLDPFQRKFREECGKFLQKIAGKSEVWRVFAGIGQKLNQDL